LEELCESVPESADDANSRDTTSTLPMALTMIRRNEDKMKVMLRLLMKFAQTRNVLICLHLQVIIVVFVSVSTALDWGV
jgi:hypothetical protein